MEERTMETTEQVVDKVIKAETEVMPTGKMEFRLINPTEDGFIQRIQWNKDELEMAVRAKIAAYTDVVYTEENMKQAKEDRAELNKLVKAIEERRKKVKEIVNAPYAEFEKEVKGILQLIQEPVGMIDSQIKNYENQQKKEKKQALMDVWLDAVGDMADILPFEKVFVQSYLNANCTVKKASKEIVEKVECFKTDLETIDSLDSKYKLNAKDVYIKTLDLSKALAENKRLVELEQRMEEERKRKEEEERKREEEQQAKIREEEEKKQQEADNAIEESKSVSETVESVSKPDESVAKQPESVSESAEIASETAQVQNDKAEPVVTKHEPTEKKYKTKFYAVGTREQLQLLTEFMKNNGIKFGKVE